MKKVVILGPESTGKSSLASELASHFQTIWVPEFARQYLHEHGKNYRYEDLLIIAKGQVELEEASLFNAEALAGQNMSSTQQNPPAANDKLIFLDTDMYVMKVWCEFVFEKCHPWILEQVVKRNYDLYLLCNIDLPWVADELREYPDLHTREKLYHMYKDVMVNQAVPWADISGGYEERFQKAKQAISKHLL